MKRFDYHLHTDHSMDCQMPLDVLCDAAIKQGLDEICITDHTEFGHPDPASDQPPDTEKWLSDIRHARQQYPELTIRAGMEIGDNPRCRAEIVDWHTKFPLDFMLLSLHLIDNEDPFFPAFFDGKEQVEVYRRYVECKLESVLGWPVDRFDAVAHLGYCAKFAPYSLSERPLRWHHAPEAFEALFRYMAENGKALEINTSGIRTMQECIPDRDLLSRFASFGGEFVTIGSDAHMPQHVGNDFDYACELAKSCGIRYALLFEQRKPMPVML